jgi:hypothetical protein
MSQQSNQSPTQSTPPFTLTFIEPYGTFHEGNPTPIPYVIDGLLTQGGFSALAGKPKSGKSSVARYEAVCVAKGQPFLNRATTRGEVILVTLEDPRNHVDNCLKALGYDPKTDGRILIVEKLSPHINRTIEAIGDALSKMPEVRLVIIDTLAKLLRVGDLNEYMQVLKAVEQVHDLARSFPQLHIQGLAHCKKVKTDDPFDALLGSAALRGEPDTTIAMYLEGGQRVIATETRIGRNIPATILCAELVPNAGADVMTNFSLGEVFDQFQSAKGEKAEHKRKVSHEERIVTYLQGRDGCTASQETTLENVEGRRESKFEAIETLKEAGVLTVTGVKHSPIDPLVLHLNTDALPLHNFINRYGSGEQGNTN